MSDSLLNMVPSVFGHALIAILVAAACSNAAAETSVDYVGDVKFAGEQIEQKCAVLLKSKEIDWKAVTDQFTEEAAAVNSGSDHLVLLVRLLARLNDGHATVRPEEAGRSIQ